MRNHVFRKCKIRGWSWLSLSLAVLVVHASSWLAADDAKGDPQGDKAVYAVVSLRQLEWLDGKPSETANKTPTAATSTRLAFETPHEAFLETPTWRNAEGRWPPLLQLKLAIKLRQAADIQGTIHWPEPLPTGKNYRFRIAAEKFSADKRREFLEIREAHYAALVLQELPGAAVFRHELRATREALGVAVNAPPAGNLRPATPVASDFDRSFELLSGERAIHENLQLDQQMVAPEPAVADVPLESLAGITVREFDWKPHVEGKSPAKDRLASFIPVDQHAVFFPSFPAFAATLDALQQEAGPQLEFWEPGLAWKDLQLRYERQLGVAIDAPARALGPQYIDRVAMTGGDPYVRSGTDIALLFQTSDAGLVVEFIEGLTFIAAQSHQDVRSSTGKLGDVSYTERKNERRTMSSYVARVDDVIVVTNSLAQLRRIVETRAGRQEPLANSPEYTFFRDRYKLGDATESAFLIISDPTIRRWCGPRWRIGAARRTRAAAVLADARVARADQLLQNKLAVGPLPEPHPAATGVISYSPEKLFHCADYGNERFLTPIGELEFDKVTKEEAARYVAWRDLYQRYWRTAFDPIALRVSLAERKMAFDLTVMPLIDNTQYRLIRDQSAGGAIGAMSGDPHNDSILHMLYAVNRDSEALKRDGFDSFLRELFVNEQGRGDPAKWIGSSVSLYVDNDPIWSKAPPTALNELDQILTMFRFKLPVALRLESVNHDELQAGLDNLFTKINQFLRSGLKRETREYRGQKYVCVSARDRENSELNAFLGKGWEIFSLADSTQWLISFNEPLVKRAIDRVLSSEPPGRKRDAIPESKESKSIGVEWLGKHAALELHGPSVRAASGFWQPAYLNSLQLTSYRNAPILAEWRRRYPDRDPVDVHYRVTGRRIECPSGGQYVWNDAALTFESSTLGHYEQRRGADLKPPILENLRRLSLGVTFELDGLRARGEWERE